MTTTLPLDEAARHLGIHPATLRRRLHKGLVRGTKQATPQGYVWLVELDDQAAHAPPESTHADALVTLRLTLERDALAQEVRRLSAHTSDLQTQLESRVREVGELHVTINRLLLALPAPAPQSTIVDRGDGHAEDSSATHGIAAPAPEPRRWWARLGDWLSGAPASPASS